MGGAWSGHSRVARASTSRQVTVIRFRHGAATSVGRVRKVNEDSLLAVPPLFVVADGMGGHGAGNVASRIAIEEMTSCAALRPLFAEAFLTALEHANRHIIERDEANRMGTTATGLAGLETAGGDHLMVFNIGDSRVYRLSGGRLEQITVDHSEVQELVLAGVITPEQARTHPRRNIVTRALGSDPVLHADHWLLPATGGDRYLVCSDGLFGEVTDEVIHRLLSAGGPQQAADALVAAANEAGGHDNVTAVVVDIDSDDDGADETTLPREVLARDAGSARTRADVVAPTRADSVIPRRDTTDSGGGQRRARGPAPVDVGLRGLGLVGPDPVFPGMDDRG
jgi:PPM family protein phosphatase